MSGGRDEGGHSKGCSEKDKKNTTSFHKAYIFIIVEKIAAIKW